MRVLSAMKIKNTAIKIKTRGVATLRRSVFIVFVFPANVAVHARPTSRPIESECDERGTIVERLVVGRSMEPLVRILMLFRLLDECHGAGVSARRNQWVVLASFK